ncbi:MAG TPA: pitrilysin family protein [Candidatus Paceibacterota bacterium]|nr:pitrilysin family protein [Candidatus Paceibacterota bacterium]
MENQFDFQTHVFESGLRLVTVPMEGTRTVTVMVMAGTGSKYEAKEINGISHFLEHMMFKGTTKRPGPLDISRELESIGAQFNAFTSKELTGYYAKASSDKVDVIMDVIFDIYLNSKLDEEAIQTERHVVVEEINMYNDDPPAIANNNFERLLYGDQPAGWSIAGEKETILNLKRQQFIEYFNTHYIAENTVVAIAGNIDPASIREKVGAFFEHIRQGKKFTKPAVTESQQTPQADIFQKATDQTHFILGFRAFDMFDKRRYALAVLASILGGGMSSRLFSEVREKRGLAYYVGAGQQAYTDSGYLEISAGVNNGKAAEALEVILSEVRKIKREGVTPLELRQAIDKIIGRTALALEHSDFVAQSVAESMLFRNEVLTPAQELDKIKKVTLSDIMQIASEMFDNAKMNLALVGPFKEAEPFENLLSI